jgi:hypothetical protein
VHPEIEPIDDIGIEQLIRGEQFGGRRRLRDGDASARHQQRYRESSGGAHESAYANRST